MTGSILAMLNSVMTIPKQAPIVDIPLPVVRGNKVYFSWPSHPVFSTNHYWIEYPNLEKISPSPGKLTESLFPLCIAFAALGIPLKLPVRLPDDLWRHWMDVINIVSRKFFKKKDFRLVNGEAPPCYRPIERNETLLCFGGGTESLLCLAYLSEVATKPILGSFSGPAWSGSNPEKNPHKFIMDEQIASEFGLETLRVHTNFREIVNGDAWRPYLKEDISMLNSVLLLPFFISFIFPIAEQFGIRHIINGNEKMNFPDEYFCFSPDMTLHYESLAQGVDYRSQLGNFFKEEVCRELYLKYPQFAKYQYSCWRNLKQRWCYQCESCLEYFALLKNYGVDPELIGMEETKIRIHRDELVEAVSQSAESRPGELWERMCEYPNLKQDLFLSRILNEIKTKSRIYHSLKNIYRATPYWIKALYRSQKLRIKNVREKQMLGSGV